jgi:hemoglobin-like flavoprotein
VAAGTAWRETPAFRTQSLKFVQTISQTVKNLNRPEHLSTYLQEIGARHVKLAVEQGFSSDMWRVFRDAIYVTMKKRIESG